MATLNNYSQIKIEQLVERLTAMDDEVKLPLLKLLNRFIANYHGLYWLVQLVDMLRKEFRPILHGGYNTVSLIDPTTVHGLVVGVILAPDLPLAQKIFTIRALFTTDIDYITSLIDPVRVERVREFMEGLKVLLNGSIPANQFELFRRYFTSYYFDKNCKHKIQYQNVNMNNELFRLKIKCGEKISNLMDIHGDDARELQHPMNIFIEDSVDILRTLLDNPTELQLSQGQKRLFRMNLLFSLIQHRRLNYFEHDFPTFRPNRFAADLVDFWNRHAERFLAPEMPLLTVSGDGALVWNNRPIHISDELFDSISASMPARRPYYPAIMVTNNQVRQSALYLETLNDRETVGDTGEKVGELKRLIRRYTQDYYHQMNSCLFNYVYDKKCPADLLRNCLNLTKFIKYFSERFNGELFSDRIRVYRTENNVALGLIGGYYQCRQGDSFINPVFWSTSYEEVVNLGEKNILLEITLRPVDAFLIITSISQHRHESEILIPFGTIFRVTGRQLVEAGDHNYLLVQLEVTGGLDFHNMPEYYSLFHTANYSHLPNDQPIPRTVETSMLTCRGLINMDPGNFRQLYNAFYSRTIPVVVNFGGRDYVLKFYLYRNEINGIRFPTSEFRHPLDIELTILDITRDILNYGYVTPNYLAYYPKYDGYCNLGKIWQILQAKQLCRLGDSWACTARRELEPGRQFLSRVPYRLLEKADQTAETWLPTVTDPNIALEYLFQLFYSLNILHQRYGFVHFDLKPGNVFLRDIASRPAIYFHNDRAFHLPHLANRLKIADYDASFLRGVDNIFISRDDYHQYRIDPYTFENDRDRLDVKMVFMLHREEDVGYNLNEAVREVFDNLERRSENLSISEFLNVLCDEYLLHFEVTPNLPEVLLSDRYNIYANYFSQHYQCYLPVLDQQIYPIVNRDEGPRFIQPPDPFVLTRQAKHFRGKLRIMTYNVHEFQDANNNDRTREIWDNIHKVAPDVLVLQEGTIRGAPVAAGSGYQGDEGAIVRFITGSTDYVNTFRCKADADLYNYIYLRNTVTSVRVLFNGQIGLGERCAIILDCHLRDYRFILVTTHLSVNFDEQRDNVNQLLTLIDRHAPLGCDVIITGDFNSYSRPTDPADYDDLTESKYEYYSGTGEITNREDIDATIFAATDRLYEHGFIDTYDLYAIQHSVSSFKPLHTSIFKGKIDHIMVNRRFSRCILGCYQIMTNDSDHTALAIDVLTDRVLPSDDFYATLPESSPDLIRYLVELIGYGEIPYLVHPYPNTRREWNDFKRRYKSYLEGNNASRSSTSLPSFSELATLPELPASQHEDDEEITSDDDISPDVPLRRREVDPSVARSLARLRALARARRQHDELE